jgi:predicted DNA-binding protein
LVKTTFDLPPEVVRRAKMLAAHQGRPLRDLVAEAIDEKVEVAAGEDADAAQASEVRRETWDQWKGRLERQPDGIWYNLEGIEDDAFFQSLEEVREDPCSRRDPYGSDS